MRRRQSFTTAQVDALRSGMRWRAVARETHANVLPSSKPVLFRATFDPSWTSAMRYDIAPGGDFPTAIRRAAKLLWRPGRNAFFASGPLRSSYVPRGCLKGPSSTRVERPEPPPSAPVGTTWTPLTLTSALTEQAVTGAGHSNGLPDFGGNRLQQDVAGSCRLTNCGRAGKRRAARVLTPGVAPLQSCWRQVRRPQCISSWEGCRVEGPALARLGGGGNM